MASKCPKCDKTVYFGERIPGARSRIPFPAPRRILGTSNRSPSPEPPLIPAFPFPEPRCIPASPFPPLGCIPAGLTRRPARQKLLLPRGPSALPRILGLC